MNRASLILALLLAALTACKPYPPQTGTGDKAATVPVIPESPCGPEGWSAEFIYTGLQDIPEDKDERSLFVAQLRKQKYDQVESGRGNWEDGPRILSYTYRKNDCRCIVKKRYRSVEGESLYEVSEDIFCGSIM